VHIENCTGTMNDGHAGGAALALRAADAVVLKNTFSVAANPDTQFQQSAWGGIHIMGGSARIRVADNIIHGGHGHGITLGGIIREVDDDSDTPQRDDVVIAIAEETVAVRFVSTDGSPVAEVP